MLPMKHISIYILPNNLFEKLTVHNAQTSSLLPLTLPALHLRISLNIQLRSLLQAQDKISSRSWLNEGSDSPPGGVSVVLWSAASRQAVLDDLVAGRGGCELWAGGEVADKLDLREWAWGGGRECAESSWGAGGAEDLAGEHGDGFGDVLDWIGGEGCGSGMWDVRIVSRGRL